LAVAIEDDHAFGKAGDDMVGAREVIAQFY
jgi:hypothetical protein